MGPGFVFGFSLESQFFGTFPNLRICIGIRRLSDRQSIKWAIILGQMGNMETDFRSDWFSVSFAQFIIS